MRPAEAFVLPAVVITSVRVFSMAAIMFFMVIAAAVFFRVFFSDLIREQGRECGADGVLLQSSLGISC